MPFSPLNCFQLCTEEKASMPNGDDNDFNGISNSLFAIEQVDLEIHAPLINNLQFSETSATSHMSLATHAFHVPIIEHDYLSILEGCSIYY